MEEAKGGSSAICNKSKGDHQPQSYSVAIANLHHRGILKAFNFASKPYAYIENPRGPLSTKYIDLPKQPPHVFGMLMRVRYLTCIAHKAEINFIFGPA